MTSGGRYERLDGPDLYVDADGIKRGLPDKSVNTSSGCENASPRWAREATPKDAMALGYPPNEAIAWACGYNVARSELMAQLNEADNAR